MTNNQRLPKAEINGIHGNLAKTFRRRLLGEMPVPLATPASGTRLASARTNS
jgi:hypothetical protein